MTVVLETRADITLDAYRRVAWEGEGVTIAAAARARMAESRRNFLALLESDPEIVVYGVTTGPGHTVSKRLSPEERLRQARRPPWAAAVAFGEPAPERVARGIALARLANFLDGHAAVSPEIAEAVAGLLDRPALPRVPLEGLGGAGEILPLAHLFGALAEERETGPKEVMALINGAPVAAALLADQALAAARRCDLALDVFALAAEAFAAPLDAYDPAFAALWGDDHEARALAGIRARLEGGTAARRPYQAPVSYRILPRILGQALRAAADAERAAAVALASVTDNPVYLAPDDAHPFGRALSNGGFQNAQAAPALDGLAGAWADLSLLAERQGAALVDPRISGLPDELRAGEGYVGCLGMAQTGAVEAARRAAQRTLLPAGAAGGFGQNDVATPSVFAWRAAVEAGDAFDAALAILAALAGQALFVTGRPATPALAPLLDLVHMHFPPVTDVRPLGPDIDRLAAAFSARIYPDRPATGG